MFTLIPLKKYFASAKTVLVIIVFGFNTCCILFVRVSVVLNYAVFYRQTSTKEKETWTLLKTLWTTS